MAQPFEITAATNSVVLNNSREGVATFTVRNLTRRHVRAVAKVLPLEPNLPAVSWISIIPLDGAGVAATTDVRDFQPEATQQYRVRVSAPTNATPGSHAFKLVVAEEINPDENYTESPGVTFTLPDLVRPERYRVSRWLIPLVIVVVAVVALIALIVAGQNADVQSGEATQTAVEAGRRAAETATAQTAIAAITETAQAQAAIDAQRTAEALTAQAAISQTAVAAATQTVAAQTAVAAQRTADAVTARAATQAAAETATALQRTADAARLTAIAEIDPCLTNPRLPQCQTDGPVVPN